jgi:hypothetical protein
MTPNTCAQCGRPAGPSPIRNGSVVLCSQHCYREALQEAADAHRALPDRHARPVPEVYVSRRSTP